MNIVVAMKQIPDLQQIRIRNRQPVLNDIPLTFGNIDKNALEAGVQLKETIGGKVIVIAAGSDALEDTIKEALAAGADEACLIINDQLENIESATSAEILAGAIKNMEDVGIIIFGEGSGDNYSGQAGSRVAGILGLPQVAYAKSIHVSENRATIVRSLEDCDEVLETELPVIVSVLADINEARIPSVTQILKAGKKPKEILNLEIPVAGLLETLSNLAPEMKRKQIEIKNVDELIKALEAEGFRGRN
ncbi:electron transfer flavoprotein subunit beta/FixA family protein [Syntrophomonas wolfei]|jgi:electron transfer flavoprotein beta subunit|uniref:electron transfer flavoprotein subunit beta/FixA family protein n=1 Tax=Syntrophomonas wolfei TaxID=863 RepID=UPI0023F04B2A|nr:electron transfer flavoprotein subunit beta/FixA family protein [Syntrophomonas wolfei]